MNIGFSPYCFTNVLIWVASHHLNQTKDTKERLTCRGRINQRWLEAKAVSYLHLSSVAFNLNDR